jgi:Na+/pantothenate symporter
MVTVPVQLSLAVTAAMLDAGTAEAQLTVVLAGMELMTGGVWSFTVIVCVAVLKLPHTSVALYTRVTVNRFVQVWLVITSGATVMVTEPLQLSLAVTAAMFDAGTAGAQLTVVLEGMELMTGGVWSFTVMVCVAVLKLPHTSVALYTLVMV